MGGGGLRRCGEAGGHVRRRNPHPPTPPPPPPRGRDPVLAAPRAGEPLLGRERLWQLWYPTAAAGDGWTGGRPWSSGAGPAAGGGHGWTVWGEIRGGGRREGGAGRGGETREARAAPARGATRGRAAQTSGPGGPRAATRR